MNLARSAVLALYTDYTFSFEDTCKTGKWALCKHFENVSYSMRFRCHETVSIGNRILLNRESSFVGRDLRDQDKCLLDEIYQNIETYYLMYVSLPFQWPNVHHVTYQ